MKRLDEEMQLNAFIFHDIEQTESDNAAAMSDKKENNAGSSTCDDRKKEYILRRAQIVVYQYGKKREMFKKLAALAGIMLIAAVIGVIRIIINRDQLEYIARLIYGGICLATIVGTIISITVLICHIKRLYSICQDIYSLTVKFQTSAESYRRESKQQNLDSFVIELEKYVKRGRERRDVKK